jgi:hypothetical protein
MTGAGSLKCLLFLAPWPTGQVVPRPYPKSKLWCFEFSPIASRMAKMRPSLSLFSPSQREQVGSPQGAACAACSGRYRLGGQAPDGIT